MNARKKSIDYYFDAARRQLDERCETPLLSEAEQLQALRRLRPGATFGAFGALGKRSARSVRFALESVVGFVLEPLGAGAARELSFASAALAAAIIGWHVLASLFSPSAERADYPYAMSALSLARVEPCAPSALADTLPCWRPSHGDYLAQEFPRPRQTVESSSPTVKLKLLQ